MTSPMSQTVRTVFVGDFGSMNRGLDDVNGRFKTIATSMKAMAATGIAVAGIAFFKNAIDEAREAEKVTRQTQAVLTSTGGVANVTAKQISDLAGSLSEVAGVDDEVIQGGENLLLTFTKVRNEAGAGNDIFNQATEIALDMSAAMGTDLNGAVIKVGKALNNPISGLTALSKVGVQFTQEQKEQIKTLQEHGDMLGAQQVILRELKTEFGGMAAASADSIDKLGVAWGNFAEDVGKKVMPAVTAVSNWALNVGIPALGDIANVVGNVVGPAFNVAIDAGKGLVGVWNSMPGPIQVGAIALAGWAIAGDRVTGFLNKSAGPLKNFNADVQQLRTAASLGGTDISRFGASIAVLEDRVPTIGRMGDAFRKARGEASGFGSTLKGIGAGAMSGMKSAATGLIGVLGGGWGLAIAGGAALIAAFANKSAEAAQKQADFANSGKQVAQVIAEQNGVVNESVRQATAKQAADRGLLDLASQLHISGAQVTSALLNQGTAYSDLTSKLREKASIDGGQLNTEAQLLASLAALHGQISAGTEQTHQIAQATKGWNDETQKVATQSTVATSSTDLFRAAIESTGAEFDESASMADQLRQAIDQLTAAEMQQIDTLESYEAAQDALTASVQQNGRTLDIHTEAGRRNRDALEDVAKKSRDLMQADIDSGVPMNQALARHNQRIAALRKEAKDTFGAKSQADKLITTYSKVPKNVTTAIRQKGYEDVNRKMLDLSSKQFLLSQGMPITPSNLRAVQKEKNQQRSGGYATGGMLRGPGTSTSDSIPLWGSRGEYITQASSVAYYGKDFMDAINQRMFPKNMMGYAGGGMVWPINVNLRKTKVPDWIQLALAAARNIPGGGGVARWSGLVLQVLRMLGQPASLLPNVLRRMNQESGGNPRAINLWDSNAQRGYPSQGLMQTIPGTFNAYAGPFRARGITDPLANIYAGLNYAIHRYGNLRYAMDKPGGYRRGGVLGPGEMAYNETRQPEYVFNKDQIGKLGQKHYHLHLAVTNNPVDLVQQYNRLEALQMP